VKNVYVGAAITYALVVAVLYHLTHAISGRAAYLMTGAMMGTWMATNVWVHIIPAQKALVASVVARTPPDAKYAKHAKTRSRHNNYMTYPVVLIMLSNHFPGAYGHSYNWLILAVLIACGASVRHLQNVTRELSPAILIGALAVVFAVGHSALTSPALQSGPSTAGSAATPLVASRAKSRGGPLSVDNEASVGHAKGVVLLDGNPPPAKAINVGSCVAESTIKNEAILSVGGKLQNAFVWVKSGLSGYPASKAPADPIVLDQKGCLYRPHVVGAQVGQRVVILNSDPVFHNVRTVADQNTSFNEMMPTKDMRLEKIFDKPEVMVRAKCDVHPWMSAFVGVVPHPFFAVSSESGEFSLENLPAGEYEIEAWHEALGRQTQKVRIESQKSITLSFTFRVE
jgi:plastocyanin